MKNIRSFTNSEQYGVQEVEHPDCSRCGNDCLHSFDYFKHPFYSKGMTLDIGIESTSHIVFLLTGELLIAYDTDKKYTLTADNMAFIFCGYEHRITAIEDSEFILAKTSGTIHLGHTFAAKSVSEALKTIDEKFPVLSICPSMHILLDSIKNYIKDNTQCAYLYRAKCMELFVIFRSYYSIEQIVQFFYTILGGKFYFQSQVLANYRIAKNVEQLAQLSGYGLSTFKQMFKKYFNQTPYKWMMETLSHDIYDALKNKDIPLKMVVSQFNFTDQSHLNVYCKKYLGATPRQIREN